MIRDGAAHVTVLATAALLRALRPQGLTGAEYRLTSESVFGTDPSSHFYCAENAYEGADMVTRCTEFIYNGEAWAAARARITPTFELPRRAKYTNIMYRLSDRAQFVQSSPDPNPHRLRHDTIELTLCGDEPESVLEALEPLVYYAEQRYTAMIDMRTGTYVPDVDCDLPSPDAVLRANPPAWNCCGVIRV